MLAGAELGKFHADQYAAHEKLIAQVGASLLLANKAASFLAGIPTGQKNSSIFYLCAVVR